VNSVPYEARLKVDIRSESEDELTRLESALRECIAAGVRDEMDSARDRSKGKLEWKVEPLGSRPGGELASDSALLAALRAADEFVGNQSRIERSSTDANIPLSLGIDAISIGAGGSGGGAHSLQEWYDSAGREAGLKRVLLTILGISGVAEEKPDENPDESRSFSCRHCLSRCPRNRCRILRENELGAKSSQHELLHSRANLHE